MFANEFTKGDCETLSRLDFRKGTYVFAVDQYGKNVLLYDLDRDDSNPEACEIWSLQLPDATATNVSGIKYRENTVYGDVLLVVASGGLAALYHFPSGEKIWSCTWCGNNPHSIEILPNGAIVTASSTGGQLRVYDSSKPGDEGPCQDLFFRGSHAALWDPHAQLLWVAGDEELSSFTFEPDGMGGTVRKQERSVSIVNGHELTADFFDTNNLYLSADPAIYSFNKTTYTLTELPPETNHKYVKGFGKTMGGKTAFVYTNTGPGTEWENCPIAGWCADRFYLYDQITGTTKTYISKKRAYYKIFVPCGSYQ